MATLAWNSSRHMECWYGIMVRGRTRSNKRLSLCVYPNWLAGHVSGSKGTVGILVCTCSQGIGAVCHTLNPRLFEKDLEYIINHAGEFRLRAGSGFLGGKRCV